MSELDPGVPIDHSTQALIDAFQRLGPSDRDLVVALVHRLAEGGGGDGGSDEYPPDVPFMDFEV